MNKAAALRIGRRGFGCSVESLERRDCPAALSITNVSLPEGTNASPIAQFLVSLSQKSSTAVLVNWATADGTATVADNDYRPTSGTIFFSPGQKSKTVTVYVRGDAVVEQDEFFSVRLSAAVGATLGQATATATIRNDDVLPLLIPSLSISGIQRPEGNGGRSESHFTIALSEPTNVAVTVRCATVDGTATVANSDYAAASWKLVFAPGETSKTVSVSVLGDSRIESDETFGLVLSNPTGATIKNSLGTATIRNDDFPPPTPVLVSVAGTSIIEGDDGLGSAVFTFKLSRMADSVVTVAYRTFDGSATTADSDYQFTDGILSFELGETTKTVVVPVIGDAKPEKDETFSLVLLSAVGASLSRIPAKATLVDDDTPPEIRVANVALTEGDAGSSTASFAISLNRSWDQPVVVAYATRDGSATVVDSDYVSVQGNVTFAPGETQKAVDVLVIGDTRAEINEQFALVVSSATNATIVQGTGTATIRNDDSGEVPGFQITIAYSGTVRQSIQAACDWAAQRWSEVITGDLPGVSEQGGVFVDDLRITVREGLLGGGNDPGGTLANAGPVAFRSGVAGLPWDALAGIDPYDASDSQLRSIVLHEFGHALGFGTSGNGLHTFYSRWVGVDGFVGPNALREYRSLFGEANTAVPLETGGGSGTAGAHWRDTVLQTELMTGYSERAGVAMPLSAITVGAMQDLGYLVNYTAADPYTVPGGGSSSSAEHAGASAGPAPANQSIVKAASLLSTSAQGRRTPTVDAAFQASLVTAAQPVGILPQSVDGATARSPKDRMFVALAARIAHATDGPLSTLAWRTLGPA